MKISKQLLMIAPMLFMFIASGCSKNLFNPDGSPVVLQEQEDVAASPWDPKTQTGSEPSSGLYEKPGAEQNFTTAEQGTTGNGSTSALSGESFTGNSSSGLYEKPGPGPDFGSAPEGMPGNGASGAFSANSFDDNRGGSAMDKTKPDFREESVGEFETASRSYEKPDSALNLSSQEKGMPGNGSAGSFTAEPYVGDGGRGQASESAEPFLPEAGDNMAVALPSDEQARRQLSYHDSNNLKDIHFAFDKFDLDNNSRAILKKNVVYLETHPNIRIEIQGHCDERGSNNYNITLGERRARSTKAFLVANGIEANRIHAISYGEERPFCFENNEKCWYQNRRGHFLVAE